MVMDIVRYIYKKLYFLFRFFGKHCFILFQDADYEKECKGFYLCATNNDIQKIYYHDCEAPLLFDMEIKACNFPNQVKCDKGNNK